MANSNLTAIYFIGNPLLHTVLIKNGSNESLNMDYGSWTENWMPFNNPSIQYVCVDENQLLQKKLQLSHVKKHLWKAVF